MRIEFYEQNGKIGIRYSPDEETELRLNRLDHRVKTFERGVGFVPDDIRREGAEAIQRYATQACCADLERLEASAKQTEQARRQRMENVNHPLLVNHKDGSVLRGRIVNAPSDIKVAVVLEEPFQCRTEPYIDPTCYASAAFGHRTFDINDGRLTPWAIHDAEEKLVELYENKQRRRKHGDVIDLVEMLNRQGGST